MYDRREQRLLSQIFLRPQISPLSQYLRAFAKPKTIKMPLRLQFCAFSILAYFLYESFVVVFLGFAANYETTTRAFCVATLFAALFSLTYGAFASTTLTRPSPAPARFRVPIGVHIEALSETQRAQLRERLIATSGANFYHAYVCRFFVCTRRFGDDILAE